MTFPEGTFPDVASVLELSNERDAFLARIDSAFREGFDTCWPIAFEAARQAEPAEPVDVDEPAWPQQISPELDRRRWPPHGRARFAEPRPGDYQGGALPAERPGMVWLAGPAVHYHGCTEACRSYAPGWYSADDSVAIIAALDSALGGAA